MNVKKLVGVILVGFFLTSIMALGIFLTILPNNIENLNQEEDFENLDIPEDDYIPNEPNNVQEIRYSFSKSFLTKWDTTKTSYRSSNIKQVKLPLESSGSTRIRSIFQKNCLISKFWKPGWLEGLMSNYITQYEVLNAS